MPRQKLHCYIIVHGEKPDGACGMHREFIRRLDTAVESTQKGAFDGIIVTGGVTRKHCTSEASMGAEYLRNKVDIPIMTEGLSHT
ncbi:MAG: ElyC/SanA/YdcF family protein, partial [Patescibacteria group bacterium]